MNLSLGRSETSNHRHEPLLLLLNESANDAIEQRQIHRQIFSYREIFHGIVVLRCFFFAKTQPGRRIIDLKREELFIFV